MKLITLNIWGGRVKENLESFFAKYEDVDMYCFQEVFQFTSEDKIRKSTTLVEGYEPDHRLFDSLGNYLPSHTGEFCQTFKGTYGLATFLKPNIEVLHHGETFVAKGDWETNPNFDDKDHNRKIQWMELRVGDKVFLLANAHLTHRPEGKLDSEKRIQQSKTIIDFLAMFDCPKMLVGDFNLMPQTESIGMFEKAGMRNLIKEYAVTSTRTKLYRRFKDGPKFADYIFVSPEITVKDFKVLPELVSDHSPLFIDFEL